LCFYPGLASDSSCPTCASCVAGIIGVNCHAWP
jgi:hypothetical protein